MGRAWVWAWAAVALAGCGSTADEPIVQEPVQATSEAETSSQPSSSPGPTAAPSESGPGDDPLANVITNTPKDLIWAVGEVPESWTTVVQEQGEVQWQVSEQCLLTLNQPAGLDPDEPSEDQIITDMVTRLAEDSGVQVEQGPVSSRQFPVQSNLKDTSMAEALSTAGFSAPDGVQGEVYAHRGGEFALIMITVCGGGSFEEVNGSQLQPFITEQLTIGAEY